MGKGTRRGGRRGGRARAHRSHARHNHRHHIHTRAHVGHHRHHFNTGFHHRIGGLFSNRHGRRRHNGVHGGAGFRFNFGTTTSRRTTIATTGIAPILCIAGFVLTVAGIAMTASSWTDYGFFNDTPSNDPLLIIGPVCLCLGGLLFISGVLICVFCKYCITSPVADTESGTNADSATANNQNDNELGQSSLFLTTLFTTDGEQQFGQSTTHLPPQYGQHQAYPPNTGQPTGEYTPQPGPPPPTGLYVPQPGVPPAASGQYAPQTGFPPPTIGPSAPQPGAPQPGYASYTSQPGAVPSAPLPTSYGMYAGQYGNDYNTQYNQPQPGQSPAAPPPSYESVTKGIHGSQEI